MRNTAQGLDYSIDGWSTKLRLAAKVSVNIKPRYCSYFSLKTNLFNSKLIRPVPLQATLHDTQLER